MLYDGGYVQSRYHAFGSRATSIHAFGDLHLPMRVLIEKSDCFIVCVQKLFETYTWKQLTGCRISENPCAKLEGNVFMGKTEKSKKLQVLRSETPS